MLLVAFLVGLVCGSLLIILMPAPRGAMLEGAAATIDKHACDETDSRAHRALHVAAAVVRCVRARQLGMLPLLYVRALERNDLPSPDELASRLNSGAPPS